MTYSPGKLQRKLERLVLLGEGELLHISLFLRARPRDVRRVLYDAFRVAGLKGYLATYEEVYQPSGFPWRHVHITTTVQRVQESSILSLVRPIAVQVFRLYLPPPELPLPPFSPPPVLYRLVDSERSTIHYLVPHPDEGWGRWASYLARKAGPFWSSGV